METQFKRHNKWDIFIHWFNAVCWILLLATGIGLISNEMVNPLGQWWPDMMRAITGGGANLLDVHIAIGVIWMAGFVAYLIFNLEGARFFLREVFTVNPSRDITWMIKKPIQMTLGDKGLKMLGMSTDLPPQGFYNMGQKSFAQPAVIGSVVIAITGVIMAVSSVVFTAETTWIVSWSILLHYVFVGLILAGLLVHIFMAAIAREERPAFFSMFTGSVPEEYAKHHHELWYEEVKATAPRKGTRIEEHEGRRVLVLGEQ
jgi:formate dehydrogenase subunit gamma